MSTSMCFFPPVSGKSHRQELHLPVVVVTAVMIISGDNLKVPASAIERNIQITIKPSTTTIIAMINILDR